MARWLTTHWPMRVDEPEHNPHSGVWVISERRDVISQVQPCDHVFIYETKTGKVELRLTANGREVPIRRRTGREGIVALVEVTKLADEPKGSKPQKYTDGSTMWWRWHAPTRPINTSGFIPREQVNDILGYDRAYVFRGYGEGKSGLGRLREDQYEQLLKAFTSTTEKKDKATVQRLKSAARFGPGGEGQEHRALKERVAEDPAAVLGEEGLRLYEKEMPLPTSDKIDVVLQDRFGRLVAIEVEVDCSEDELVGPLQCMKYRALLAYLFDRRPEEIRSILVAHSIHSDIQGKCENYSIETRVVK